MTTAQTIINQLGGNRFTAMTGAKNFSTGGNDVSFKIGKNHGKVTHVKIELDDTDTYTVKFFNIRGVNFKTLREDSMVYADNLRSLFESVTGMSTSL